MVKLALFLRLRHSCSARAFVGKAFALRLPLSYQPTHQPFVLSLLYIVSARESRLQDGIQRIQSLRRTMTAATDRTTGYAIEYYQLAPELLQTSSAICIDKLSCLRLALCMSAL